MATLTSSQVYLLSLTVAEAGVLQTLVGNATVDDEEGKDAQKNALAEQTLASIHDALTGASVHSDSDIVFVI